MCQTCRIAHRLPRGDAVLFVSEAMENALPADLEHLGDLVDSLMTEEPPTEDQVLAAEWERQRRGEE